MCSVPAEELEVLGRRRGCLIGEVDLDLVVEQLVVDGLATEDLFEFGFGEIEHVGRGGSKIQIPSIWNLAALPQQGG